MNSELGLIQKITRLYTFYSPISKGKYRLALGSLGLEKELPAQVVATTADGRVLRINFDNHFSHFIYFLGEYEPAVTNVIGSLIKPGDVCFDVGANIGWYTTLFQKLVGENGEVHSFEPMPQTFEILEENVRMNVNSGVVRLNNLALGTETGEIDLHLFAGLPDGHASISDQGRTDFRSFPCPVKTIDAYLAEHQIDDVRFVKADIEGAELAMLKGATDLFKQDIPPIFEIEMALATTRSLGYLPNDIMEFITSNSPYEFFAIDEVSGSLHKIEKFDSQDIGANVLCVPVGHYQDRMLPLTSR
jgi:FkbM family methyltransferase